MVNGLGKSILKTVAYFSLFDYPLTLVEIALFSLKDNSGQSALGLGKISDLLESDSELIEKISSHDGFFYLKGKESTVARRLSRYNLADQKFKKAFRAIRVFAALPSVKSVMICNSLSLNNAADESDIDLFLIVEPGMIWTTRLILIGLSELLGTRIHIGDSADKLCLSFFTCTGNYDFEKIQIAAEDIYLFYWIASLAPVYGPKEYLKFMESNSFFHNQLFNYLPRQLAARRLIEPSIFWKIFLFPIFYILRPFEKNWRKLQWNKLAGHKRELAMAQGTEVIINDKMLKFHDNDRRWLYQQQYRQLCNSLGLNS